MYIVDKSQLKCIKVIILLICLDIVNHDHPYGVLPAENENPVIEVNGVYT